MDTESLTRKYYAYIKGLPNIKIFLTLTSFEYIILLIRSLQISFDYLYSFLLYSVLLIALFRERYKLGLFITDLTGIPYIVLSFLPVSPIFAFGFFMPLLAYILLGSYRESLSITLSALLSFVPIIFYLKYILPYIIYIIIISLIFHLYIYTVNKKGVKILGFKSTQVAVPFIRAITEKNKAPLENFLSLISVKTTLNILLYKLDDILFVLPQIHFGIFGDIGSSRFVYDAEKTLGKNVMVFHSAGSHELDLASSFDVNKVLEEIKRSLNGNSWNKVNFYGISVEKINNFEVTSLEFDKFRISFLERPNLGIDDLPSSLWKYMLSYNNYLVDCHNNYMIEGYSKDEVESLKMFLMEQKGIKSNRKLYIGYAEGVIEKSCEGLCDNRVRVVTLSDGESKISLVYLYANNSSRELYTAMKNLEEGSRVILITPDDHSCTGVSLGITYYPAGVCEELINKTKMLVKESTLNLKEVKNIQYTVVKVKGVRVVGKIVSLMSKALEEVGAYTAKTFWIPLVTPYLALIAILLAQSISKI
ncbi:hypothetical protein BFU36_10460 [Sulfolobus sp. A20]|uniref:DUF2070 family protein n=1 Tax=Saccharolobus sp. A20 TaxID=1891280 RepID=UPI000845F8A4|nr:DUF2070 family protein [Sulfolobus sp. A20]TRM75669.1 DUF2070 domain-containing protein [Sulfolobus sp. E5]TRM79354.1 DUF2070 domain-containing protein [Sulfolobus sp. B5]TRM81331.1 DUF2070 domain-containing protein [Sulfolobus sp. D5]TRM82216.1 DUF2070 domain-containing protein [Sulfolobus sp. A20-N-F6]TRM89404.1 DUF2070 domain-containing protein [Sulfolobus sp. C3]TRM98919.1 DUF2070 domain-containing protein [Sulfolobus sp. E1]TRN00370.1 DUF2070 domain-containing protein [Sulfolobus sp.